MPKYIDADILLEEAKRLSGPITGDGWDNLGVYSLINRQPFIPSVRCKQCGKTVPYLDYCGYCGKQIVHIENTVNETSIEGYKLSCENINWEDYNG